MTVRILIGDVRAQLATLPDDWFDIIITSPPYWGLRDYGVDGQIGLEPTLGEHIAVMVELFRELRRVLKPTGTLWLNYGDCYATSPNGRSAADTKAGGGDDRTFRDKPFSTVGAIYERQPDSRIAARRGVSGNLGNGGLNGAAIPDGRIVAGGGVLKAKDLCMIPNRLAIALQDDGWWVRAENIWGKTNPMPESINDRPATAFEKVFLLTKSARYFYDPAAVRQGLASSSVGRLAQDLEGQAGSIRANGGSRADRPMKAVTAGRERGDSFNPHHKASAGDHGQKAQHRPEREGVAYVRGQGRNLRTYEPAPLTVWPMATTPFACELCTDCGAFYDRRGVAGLRIKEIADGQRKERRRYCACGSHSGWLSHFATFPPQLVERCLDAGCPPGGKVLDPFGGAGTTALVADQRGLDCTLIELNPQYATLAMHRIAAARPDSDIIMGAS